MSDPTTELSTSEPRGGNPEPASLPLGRRPWALAVLCTAFFLGVLDSTSVFAAMPSIGEDFDLDPAGVQWVSSAYAVAIGGTLLLGGRVADLYGRRRIFLASVVVFAAASVLCGLAWSGTALVGARVLQGLAAAVMTPAALSLLLTVFPEGAERNRALGIWGGLGGVGATAGLLIGGPLTDLVGWPWVFLTNVPVCLAVLAVGPAVLPRGSRAVARGRLDVGGSVAVTLAMTSLLAGVVSVPHGGWEAPRTLWLLGAGIGLLAVFAAIEARVRDPLVPVGLLRSKRLVGGNLVVLTAGMAVDGLLLLVTLHVQQVLGYSATAFGATVATMTIASIGGVLAGQRLVTRLGPRAVAIAGTLLIAGSCLVLAWALDVGASSPSVIAGLLIFGPGMGAAFVAAQIAALAGVPASQTGLASGLEETAFAFGTALGVGIVAAVLSSRYASELVAGSGHLAARTTASVAGVGVVAAFAITGAVLALALLGPNRDATSAETP